jgi:TonB family protein
VSSLAVSLPYQEVTSHPVPQCATVDGASSLLRRSAAISLALHLILLLIAVAINNWPKSAIVGTPVEEALDVTIIPLSALDTLLPKGEPNPTQIPATEDAVTPALKKTEVAQETSLPPKKIVSAKSLAPKQETRSSSQQNSPASDQDADLASKPQQFGVANGEAHSAEQARISYQDMVASLLARAKRYPERALKRRMTGEGSIRLEISADGSLADFQILRSTEAPILDEELRAMVDRAAPFPAFPSDLRKNRLALVVPIAFRLES